MPLPLFSDLSVIALRSLLLSKIWALGETKIFIKGACQPGLALMAAGEASLGLPAGLCPPESRMSLLALGWFQGCQLLPLTSCFICTSYKGKTCQHLPLPS